MSQPYENGERMPNGFKWCAWCGVGHSASCCHPGRLALIPYLAPVTDEFLARLQQAGHSTEFGFDEDVVDEAVHILSGLKELVA